MCGRNALSEEKRKLDQRVAALEEELDDERLTAEGSAERAKKAAAQAEQLQTDLLLERANAAKVENARAQLEKQNKEMKAKLLEAETAARNRTKTTITALEAKALQLEQQLENEQRDHQNAVKMNKKFEKKLKEMMTQVEDERRHAAEFKDQVCLFPASFSLLLSHSFTVT